MNDEGSAAGWGVLSFFIPIVGLILFLVWKNEKPHTANVCGICALVSFCVGILMVILSWFFLATLFATIFRNLPPAYYMITFAL